MAEFTGRQAGTPRIGHNSASLEYVEVATLRKGPRDPRVISKREIEQAKPFVSHFADRALPIVVGSKRTVNCGWIFVAAARELGISRLLVTRQDNLTSLEEQLYTTATAKLLSAGSWDGPTLDLVIRDLERDLENFSHDLLGFAPGELDKALGGLLVPDGVDELPDPTPFVVSKVGARWCLGPHMVACLDSTDAAALASMCAGRVIAAAIADPPFGCKVDGFVSKKGKHKDFVQAAGELSDEELRTFFLDACVAISKVVQPGALVFLFIDWRSLSLLQAAAEAVFGKLMNLCVWSKDRAGMGSFYRSQHELVLVFAMPGARHRNNIELGRHGRNRSNVWAYPSAASSRKGREGDILKLHPTPKSVEMVGDIILDCSARGEVIVDSFLGSGTTLIAAERTGRICYGADLDPRFVDLAVLRWQRWTGQQAVDAITGQTFEEVAATAAMEAGQ